jgi:alpha-tubulin suppressor-like RCC1 family protein
VHELTSVPALDQVGVAQMHGGEHHTLAVSHAGHVYAFGRADSNQLGVKFSAPGSSDAGAFTFEPQRVTGLAVPVESVFCGSFHCE